MDESRWTMARVPIHCEVGRCGAAIPRGEVYRLMTKANFAYCATCACEAIPARLVEGEGPHELVWRQGEAVPIDVARRVLPDVERNPRTSPPRQLEMARFDRSRVRDYRARAAGER